MKAIIVLLLAASAVRAADAPAKPNAAKLFAAKCAACHAKNAKGSAPMAKMFKLDPSALDLTSAAVDKLSDADLVKTISAGRGKMPSFKGKLKDAEISALVSYIRSLSAAPKKAEGAGQ